MHDHLSHRAEKKSKSFLFTFPFLDDETHPTDTVDLQLKLLSDTVLNDDTVVDYLLDLSQEVKQRHTHKTNTTVILLFC